MLLNKKNTKAYIMQVAKEKRPGWNPTQISPIFLQKLELKLMSMIDRAVQAHPSRGKTFKELI